MSLEDILVALRAVDEGAIDRDALSQLLAVLDTWDRGGLHPSCGELLTRQFKVDPAKVRRWEREITGQSSRRIGRYQLRRKIGQGGMGLVFEAVDPNLGRTVALKLLAGDRQESPTSIQRFLREAKSAGSLNHPNIVHAYDARFDGGLPYLVMEFIDGENLYQVLKRRGAIDPAEGIDWLVQGARALEVLERQRWVHGDVKPSNFILTRDGTVKLADLGLCGPPGKPRPGSSPYGTPPYIAPEVLAGDAIDHRADHYSLGATFYHLLAGRPHRLARSLEDLRAHAGTPLVPIGEVRPEIPPELCAVVMRLLAERPDERFPTGAALLSAVEPLLPPPPDPHAVLPPEAAPGESARAPRRGLWIALGISVVAVGVAIGIVLRPDAPQRPDATPPADAAGAESVPDTGAEERAARWAAARERAAGDFRAAFAWLAGEGSDLPERELWRAETVLELAAAAEESWARIAAEVVDHRSAGRCHAALAALDRFPAEWRAAGYEVAWSEAVEGIRRDRRARLAGLLLAFDGAGSPLAQWQVWRTLAAESPEDRAWYRLRIERERGGLPFFAAIEMQIADGAGRAAARPAFVRAELAQGRVPAPELSPGPRLPEELALAWLAERAAGRDLAPKDGEPFVDRVFTAGLLAEVEPRVLALLLAQCGERADVDAEIRGARLAAEADAARRGYDRVGAEARWDALALAPLASTAAGRAAVADRERHQDELRRGAFLRSGAFGAAVLGAWGETPFLRWSGGDGRFGEEWRVERDGWAIEPGGRRARGREAWQGLELAIPFEPEFSLSVEFEAPDGAWALVIGRGDAALGIAGDGPTGACRATAGARDSLAGQLAAGRGAPWILPGDPARPGVLRIDLLHERGLWRLVGGAGLVFPADDDPPPAWIWIAFPTGGLLRAVEIRGEPVRPWLEARARLTGAG